MVRIVFVDCGRRTTHKCYNLYYTVEMLTACDVTAVIDAKVTYWSKIVIFAPVRGSPLEYCHNLCYRKTRMAWVPDDEKILKICVLVSTEYTNVTDRRTDRRMENARRHRLRSCIASRGKNHMHIRLSLSLHFCLLYLFLNSCDGNDVTPAT